MQTFFLSSLFGVACAMGLWAAASARETVDAMMRRAGMQSAPDER